MYPIKILASLSSTRSLLKVSTLRLYEEAPPLSHARYWSLADLTIANLTHNLHSRKARYDQQIDGALSTVCA